MKSTRLRVSILCSLVIASACGEKRNDHAPQQATATATTPTTQGPGAHPVDPATAHLPHVMSLTGSMHLVEDDGQVVVNDAVSPNHFVQTDESGRAVIQWPDGFRVEVEPLSRIAVAEGTRPTLLLASGAVHAIDAAAATADKTFALATSRAVFLSLTPSELFVQTTADGTIVTAHALRGEAHVGSNAGATECDVGDVRIRAGQSVVLDAEHLDGTVTTPTTSASLESLRASLPHVPAVCEETALATYLPRSFASRIDPALVSAERPMVNYADIVSQRELLRRQGDSPRVRAQLQELGSTDQLVGACQNKIRDMWLRAAAYRGCRPREWAANFSYIAPRVDAVLRFRLEGTHG